MGLRRLIAKQIQQKFDADPFEIDRRLAGLGSDELEAIGERIIPAASLEYALTCIPKENLR